MKNKKIIKRPARRGITKEGFLIGITGGIIVFLLVTTLITLSDLLFLPGAVSTEGTIVSCQIERELKGGSYCNAEVNFETQSGQNVIVYVRTSTDAKPGSILNLKYHPNDLQDARIVNLQVDILLDGIGSGILLIELCTFLLWKRRRDREYVQKHKGQNKRKKASRFSNILRSQ